MVKLVTFFTFFVILNTACFSQENYPKPTAEDILFYIQHSRGKNTFIYQANFSSANHLNDKNPIKISRQLFDNNGEIKPLTNIQRKYAYGIKTEKLHTNYYEIRLVSYPSQKLYLKLDNNTPYIETTISGKYMIVKHLFIHLRVGTSGLNVKADYILFHGIDKNGKAIQAKITP
ncbi:DUF4833 domain-containing protein [Sphingobacterium composti Ten et al. 2007 non Yoo et al. 2007]|uniref:DUF4833 domain-containing protein n=1 Tax=Sphingobacterium composti TaxID=363260 RepID=UPI001358993C|nr:DUF4833 domain-containing protein [Sphingobacterium composti Ten et al. 2007 non Yoo et al. 2007]